MCRTSLRIPIEFGRTEGFNPVHTKNENEDTIDEEVALLFLLP